MFEKRYKKIIYDYVLSNYERIEVKSGKCRYNFRCSNNAVHDAITKKDSKIAMCIYFDNCNVEPVVHFINFRKGKFIDNTLGHWSSKHEYYLIRFIPEADFYNVNFIFGSLKKTFRNLMPWYVKLFNKNLDI